MENVNNKNYEAVSKEGSTGKKEGKKYEEKIFNIVVDDIPYNVKAQPYDFNDNMRYRISINEGKYHVFLWDSEVEQLRPIDDSSAILPDTLERAINNKLLYS